MTLALLHVRARYALEHCKHLIAAVGEIIPFEHLAFGEEGNAAHFLLSFEDGFHHFARTLGEQLDRLDLADWCLLKVAGQVLELDSGDLDASGDEALSDDEAEDLFDEDDDLYWPPEDEETIAGWLVRRRYDPPHNDRYLKGLLVVLEKPFEEPPWAIRHLRKLAGPTSRGHWHGTRSMLVLFERTGSLEAMMGEDTPLGSHLRSKEFAEVIALEHTGESLGKSGGLSTIAAQYARRAPSSPPPSDGRPIDRNGLRRR